MAFKCKHCRSANLTLVENSVNVKTKHKTSLNLNPLKPFTIFNTKEVKKNKRSIGKTYAAVATGGASLLVTGTRQNTKHKFQCGDCGRISILAEGGLNLGSAGSGSRAKARTADSKAITQATIDQAQSMEEMKELMKQMVTQQSESSDGNQLQKSNTPNGVEELNADSQELENEPIEFNVQPLFRKLVKTVLTLTVAFFLNVIFIGIPTVPEWFATSFLLASPVISYWLLYKRETFKKLLNREREELDNFEDVH